MAIQSTISQDLADLLVTRNFDPTFTDENGRDTSPGEAKTMSFDWIAPSGKNYGTAVAVIGEENDLQLFFGDNLGKSIEDPDDKNAWFQFLQELGNFATQHRYTFSPKDLMLLKHTMAGMAAIKEGLFEGYYGNRKVSYMGEQTDARLVIKHNRMLGENDKRYRYVESLYIETAEGERFKLPFTKLSGGRAMLEHVRQGGKPYDIRGCHIAEIVTEMNLLARFNRASQSRVFEGSTAALVESAQNYYHTLQEDLKHLASGRGYREYFESWSPADIGSEDALVEDIKTLFVEQTIDSRIESALPLLAKIQQGTAMKEVQMFESWVNRLTEGTWALPDTPEQEAKLQELMSQELIAGPDGTNATEQLYDVVGDDHLFDLISAAAAADPNTNIWDNTEIIQRLGELGIDTSSIGQRGAEQTPEPAAVTEGVLTDSTGETFDHICDRFRAECKQFRQTGELEDNLYDALFDYYLHSGEMPYGIAKARTGDPYNWITLKFEQDLGESVTNPALPMDEADVVHTFEGSCNMTTEGEYCPEHGLAECGGTVAGAMAPVMGEQAVGDPINYNAAMTGSYYESKSDDALLARIKSLAFLK